MSEYYLDFNQVAAWAYNNLKLTIMHSFPPARATYIGSINNKLVYVPYDNKLFYEIGRFVVATDEQRNKVDYGLFKYNAKELEFIHANKRINGHIIQSYRAYTYAYYLHSWFNYKLYRWKLSRGETLDIFEQQSKWPTYNLQAEVKWLHDWKLLDNFVPNGQVFKGTWELDDPYDILKGMGAKNEP